MSRDLFYFNYTVVRSDYRRLVCHDVERFVIYYFHDREVGLPTVGMSRCREVGFTRWYMMVYNTVYKGYMYGTFLVSD